MELYVGLSILAALVAWGVAGWWRYWRAVQAAAEARRYQGAQIETLWRQLHRRPPGIREAAQPSTGLDVWENALNDIEGWLE